MKLGLVVLGGLAREPRDGTIPVLHWLVERLARRHDVHVFTMFGARRPDRYSLYGATIHHAGARATRWRTLTAILREHTRGSFDLLHGFWLVPPGVVAVAAGRIIRRPVLLHVAGGELADLPEIGYGSSMSWRGRLWVRMALRGAAEISAASTPMIAALARLGFSADRISLGVDLARWAPVAPRRRTPGSPARLVHVASLNRVKDQSTLLQAARLLHEAGADFVLDIAGPDTLDGAVQSLASELGLSGRVHFHGWLAHDRLHALVKRADVLWITSRHEAGPLALLEAGVAGVPAVGTAVGHLVDWAPEAAVVVPVGDADSLARETAVLLADEERRMRIAGAAHRRALAEDADWTARRFEKVYQGLLAGNG